ncbi:MAG: signal peptidase II [Lachnospiraceae bacterium]|nr:signal peptidase II [Lachnospiraceae bacterium]
MFKNFKLKIIIEIIIFALLIFFDQFTKYLAVLKLGESGKYDVIPGFISFEMLLNGNTGGAWGIFSGKMVFFYIITLVFAAVIVFFIYRANKAQKLEFASSEVNYKLIRHFQMFEMILVCLLGGAFGNFIDRIRLHYVIDFLSFQFIDFPIFNVSDCIICISIVFLFICIIFVFKDKEFNLLLKSNKGVKDFSD